MACKTHFKICVLGDGGVGKTALTIQLCSHHFVEEYDPTIEDSYRKQVVIDDKPALLEILDTAGQEEFTALRDQWIRDSEGFVIAYSITSKTSFDLCKNIHSQILRVKDGEENVISLIGNKRDLEHKREVSIEDGQNLARLLSTQFHETSAKTRLNIDESFFDVVREIRQRYDKKLGYEEKKKTSRSSKKGCLLI